VVKNVTPEPQRSPRATGGIPQRMLPTEFTELSSPSNQPSSISD
jgi:hypothetical protein